MENRFRAAVSSRLSIHYSLFRITIELVDKVKEFMENEARSCSMNFGYITPEYVYRMWGGSVAIEDVEN